MSLLRSHVTGPAPKKGLRTHLMIAAGVQFAVIGYLWLLLRARREAACNIASVDAAKRLEDAALFYVKESEFYYPAPQPQPFVADDLVDGELVLDAPEARTLEDAARLCLEKHSPVVVRARNIRRLFGHLTHRALLAVMRASPDNVTAYYASMRERGKTMPLAQVAERYESGEGVYINDSPADLLPLPDWLAQHNGYYQDWAARSAAKVAGTGTPNGQGADTTAAATARADLYASAVVNVDGAYTALHMDVPTMGGGWHYMVEGEKHWLHLSPLYINQLRSSWESRFWWKVRQLQDPGPDELRAMVAQHAKGPMWSATLNAGDLMMWPPGSIHRVYTAQRTLGLFGYWTQGEAQEEFMKAVQTATYAEALEMGRTFDEQR